MPQQGQLLLEDCEIMFRNFAGVERQFNEAGKRNFCVKLDPELAMQLRNDGWNVKQLKVREEGDTPQDYMKVSVSYKNRPPLLVMITSRGRVNLTEDLAMVFDHIDIAKCDLIINPYHYEIKGTGNKGITAYVKSIFITVQEDYLELKYADVEYAELPAGSAALELMPGEDPDVVEGEIVSDSWSE